MQVWECKILVPDDVELPDGFDNPPRTAAIEAIRKTGIPVLACASGWGGSLTKEEKEYYEVVLNQEIK